MGTISRVGWFHWDKRLKNFRSIRHGLSVVVDEIANRKFGTAYRESLSQLGRIAGHAEAVLPAAVSDVSIAPIVTISRVMPENGRDNSRNAE